MTRTTRRGPWPTRRSSAITNMPQLKCLGRDGVRQRRRRQRARDREVRRARRELRARALPREDLLVMAY